MNINKFQSFFVWIIFHVFLLLIVSIIIFSILLLFNGNYYLFILLLSIYIIQIRDRKWFNEGDPWYTFVNWSLWKYLFLNYFSFRIYRCCNLLNPNNQYIFVIHPHGVMALSRFALFVNPNGKNAFNSLFDSIENNSKTIESNNNLKLFKKSPYFKTRALGATSILYIPILYEICLWSNVVDASRSTAERIVKRGYNIVVYPGGLSEQLDTQYKKHQIILSSRFGFVRLSLTTGSSLVPIYVFGETSMYYKTTFCLGLRKWILKKFNFPILFQIGKWFSPLFPLDTDLNLVVGQPIAIPQICNPTKKDILKYHSIYMNAIKILFDNEKHKFGCQNEELVIK